MVISFKIGKRNRSKLFVMNFNGYDLDEMVSKMTRKLKKRSHLEQMALGVSIGWSAGWLVKKIGRLTALALGGGLILLQFANEKGIIYINWDKIEKNIEQKLTITESKSNDIIDWTKSKLESKNNVDSNFVVSTVGGFFLGLGF